MQYVFIEKGIRSVQLGLGQAGEFSRIFALKVTLHSVRLLLLPSAFPVPAPMGVIFTRSYRGQ